MSKWKCDICYRDFDNFHAQGFDGKIYCPLCFFKEENRRVKQENEKLKTILSKVRKDDDLTIDEKITLEELER